MKLRLAGTILLLSLGIDATAQDLDTRFRGMQEQIDRLRGQLQASGAREEGLQTRIADLELRLGEEREAGRQRFEDLVERLSHDSGGELEQLVQGIEELRRSPGAQSALRWGGYFDFEFRHDQARRNPTFDQHRLVLQFDADILSDAISFKSEIEIEGGGADASFLSGNEIVVEFAELHFHLDPAFNVKVGALLVPFGQFNKLHDSPLRDLTDRPLVARRVIPTTWTDAGIGFYGHWEMMGMLLDYDIMLGNGLDDDFSSTTGGGFRGARNSFRTDNNDSKMVVGRIGIDPQLPFLDSTYIGLSAGFGQYDNDDDQQIWMFGFDWALKKGPFELIGEYACFDLERGQGQIDGGVPGGADGFYIQLNFHFFPESWRGVSRFFTDESTFTAVFRFGTVDTDDSTLAIDRATRGDAYRDDRNRYTLGLNFRPIEKTVFKIEYQFIDEDGFEDARNNRLVISFATYF